jgi:hypothetical protein
MNTARPAAIGAATLFGILAAFQVAIAVGAPWGRAAYGGFTAHPGAELRASSVVATLVWVAAALIVLRRVDLVRWAPLPKRAVPAAVWVIGALCAISLLPNLLSPSLVERLIWVPWAIAATALVLTVAFTSRQAPEPAR